MTDDHYNRLIDAAHRRMDRIEARLAKHNNPAPTVPQYDLQNTGGGGGPPVCGTCSDYWITTDLMMNSAIIDQQAVDPGNDFFVIEIMNTLGAFDSWELGAALPLGPAGPPVPWHVGLDAGYQQYVDSFDSDTWYHVEFHVSYDFGAWTTSPELFINGSNLGLPIGYDLSYDPSANPDRYVFFGADIADGNDGDLVSFENIKIGTIRNSNDIWDGSSLSSTVSPPFDGIWGTDASTALSASGSIFEAQSNWTVHPHGNCYAYAIICV